MVTLLAAAENQIPHSKTIRRLGRVSFCKDFWDRYWGRAIQLLANLLAMSPVTVQILKLQLPLRRSYLHFKFVFPQFTSSSVPESLWASQLGTVSRFLK